MPAKQKTKTPDKPELKSERLLDEQLVMMCAEVSRLDIHGDLPYGSKVRLLASYLAEEQGLPPDGYRKHLFLRQAVGRVNNKAREFVVEQFKGDHPMPASKTHDDHKVVSRLRRKGFRRLRVGERVGTDAVYADLRPVEFRTVDRIVRPGDFYFVRPGN